MEYKGGECERCGYNNSFSALDFHHVDPKAKSGAISQMAFRVTWEELVKEADKCVLLCRNCHAETHDYLFQEALAERMK